MARESMDAKLRSPHGRRCSVSSTSKRRTSWPTKIISWKMGQRSTICSWGSTMRDNTNHLQVLVLCRQPFSHSLSVSLCLSVSLSPVSLSVFLSCLSLSLSLCISVSVSLYPLSLSLPLSLSPYVSLSLSLSHTLSLSLSLLSDLGPIFGSISLHLSSIVSRREIHRSIWRSLRCCGEEHDQARPSHRLCREFEEETPHWQGGGSPSTEETEVCSEAHQEKEGEMTPRPQLTRIL
jgi:hypothetical protein